MNSTQASSIKIEEVFPATYSFLLNGMVYSYLIVGKEKALLIDTGWGLSDLKEAVRQITGLPLIAANSHGHMDHIQGDFQFEEIFIRDEDRFMLTNDFTEQKRAALLKRFGANCLPEGHGRGSMDKGENKHNFIAQCFPGF